VSTRYSHENWARLTDTHALQPGLVVAGYGRHMLVETPQGQRLICHPRGKKNQAVVGDRVQWQGSHDEGTIERIDARRNLFYRQDEIRTKSFAANLDQILILIAASGFLLKSVKITSDGVFTSMVKQYAGDGIYTFRASPILAALTGSS
jgi:hypothetical protein